MNAAVTPAEKAAILAHYRAQADAALYGPALGHPMDPRTPDDDTASSLRYIMEDALQAIYRNLDALDAVQSPEAMQRVIDKCHSIGRDLAGADWE